MEFYIRCCLFQPSQQFESYNIHVRCRCKTFQFRLYTIQDSAGSVIFRCMALLTAGGKIVQSVGTILFPESNVMNMQNGMILDTPSTEYTGISVSCKNSGTSGCDLIPLSHLVVNSLWCCFSFFQCFHECRIKLTHFKDGTFDRHNLIKS